MIHHDRLKLCQDRDLPIWLKRLSHTVIHPEEDKSGSQAELEKSTPQPLLNDSDDESEEEESADDLLNSVTETHQSQVKGKPSRLHRLLSWLEDFDTTD